MIQNKHRSVANPGFFWGGKEIVVVTYGYEIEIKFCHTLNNLPIFTIELIKRNLGQ